MLFLYFHEQLFELRPKPPGKLLLPQGKHRKRTPLEVSAFTWTTFVAIQPPSR
jgi:hypothetical protein